MTETNRYNVYKSKENAKKKGNCWDLGRTNSLTSARRGDGLGYIRIWAAPPKRLVFWNSAPSPTWYQSHAPNLVVCVGDVRRCRSPNGAKGAQ